MSRSGFSTSDYLAVNNRILPVGDWSICAWVYPTADNVGAILSSCNSGLNDDLYQVWMRTGGVLRLRARSNGGGTSVNCDAGTNYGIGSWQFICCKKVLVGAVRTLHSRVNNGGFATASWTAVEPNNDRFAVGVRYSNTIGVAAGNGHIGPVATWDRDLSNAEVNAMYNGLDFRYLNPAHYYEMAGTAGEADLAGSRDLAEVGTVTDPALHPVIRRPGILPKGLAVGGV